MKLWQWLIGAVVPYMIGMAIGLWLVWVTLEVTGLWALLGARLLGAYHGT
jgi:hypothetical protein